MRKLWEDHVTWTRLYIISAAAGLPDTNVTAQRLLANQTDIGNAVSEFYGRDAGNKLTSLLRDHILIAADLVTASKVGDQAKAADAKKRWYANASDIAVFLHTANPKNWPEATMQGAMKTHLDQTLDEATHRLQGKYEQDIKDYDEIVKHILMMADVLSSGIEKQFPAKFDKP
ncbi:MAG TPA: glycosyltransferase [Thermoanaerobaculia bacterium]|nr:glycosyltransferase [Thermoanaerobaculia bacterium]